MISIKIHGVAEIHRAMAQLPARMDKKLLDKGLIEGAKLFRDEARERVPLLQVPDPRRVRGAIRRAIRAGRVRPRQYRATVWVHVRPLSRRQIATFKRKTGKGASENPNDPFYWAFVEFGTSKMPARPFMRTAFEAKKLEAVRAAVTTLAPLVQAEIEKLGRLARLSNRIGRV